MKRGKVTLGTRGSPLALRQTELVVDRLRARYPGTDFDIHVIRTQADREQNRPISQFGDKGVFVRAIERELLNGKVDLAVHSLKDVPADYQTPGLELAAFSPREDPHDVLVSREGASLQDLPAGASIGTSSSRRRVQLLAARPDLKAVDIRGNVDTRLKKMRQGQYDAIIVAAAGLIRLDLADVITEYLPFDSFLPDAGQGTMAVQGRSSDPATAMARSADDPVSRAAAAAERGVVAALGAGCKSPVGAYADIAGDRLHLSAMAAVGGGTVVRREADGAVREADLIGRSVGEDLLRALGTYTDA